MKEVKIMKIKIKLTWVVTVFLLFCIIIFILFLFYCSISLSTQQKNISDLLEKNTNQVAKLLERDLKNIYTIANNTYLNVTVQKSLQLDNVQETNIYQKYQTSQLISSLSKGNPAVYDIVIYPLVGDAYHTNGNSLSIKNCYQLREQNWFQDISKMDSGFTLLPVNNHFVQDNAEQEYMVLARTIYRSNSKRIIGYQFVVINNQWIQSVLQENDEITEYYICNDDNIPLFLDENDIQTYLEECDTKQYLTTQITIADNIHVVGRYDQKYLMHRSIETLSSVLLLLFPVMLICILWCVVFIRWIERPTEGLIMGMKQVGSGDFNISLPDCQVQEIDTLSKQFLKMLDDLSSARGINQKLEMKMLLSQLNPHFLYNTLNSIYWMALDQTKTEETAEMIDILSNLLRYSLYETESPTSVEQEIIHVEKYLFLQSKRYEDRFAYDIQIDSDLYMMALPKLTFQPIVENAIKHSVEHQIETVWIKISAVKQGSMALFRFSNDHASLSPEEYAELQSRFQDDYRLSHKNLSTTGIGLYNVYRRLKLMYGKSVKILCNYEKNIFTLTIQITCD